MTFKPGQSGNPKGRRKGSVNIIKRSELARLLDPHAEALVDKVITLALGGDITALRLCMERLIPKIHREPTGIELPNELNSSNVQTVKDVVLRAALDGRISIDDAEKLTTLVNSLNGKCASPTSLSITTTDPLEAARIYQQIMLEK